jgi:hypothetical protein
MKTLHLVLIAVTGLLLTTSRARAQGVFLERGQSGFGASGGVISNNNASGISVAAGYSHLALVDVGVSVSRTSYDSAGWASLGSTGLRGYVNLNLALLGATLSYERLFYSVDSTSYADVHLSGWDGFIGGFAHLPLQFIGTLGAVPQVTLGLQHASATLEARTVFDQRGSGSSSSTSPVLRLDGNLTVRDEAGRIWAFDPMLAIDKDNATFGFFLGGVFR